MKRKITALILILAALLSFCSCGKYADVTVNGVKIGKGVYTYFLDRAKSENPKLGEAELKTAADGMLLRYVAVNSRFKNDGLTLSVDEKTELSDDVNVCWQYFGKYYEDIGVSKQDYYLIKTSEFYREKLMENYYSDNGEEPVSEQSLKDYFNKNFVAFRAVTGFLTTVDENNNTVSLPAAEREKITKQFGKMASDINEGKASIETAASYAENTIITNETVVISRNSTDYPEGFFENAIKLGNDKAGSFAIGDYIFTVERNDINSDELNLFNEYRDDCLKALKGGEFDLLVDAWSENYKVEKQNTLSLKK